MKFGNGIRSMLRVAKIELNSMFYSPVSWLVIVIFACQTGYAFARKFDGLLHSQDIGHSLWAVTSHIFVGMFGILSPILHTLYLYIPLITMGLMSREYQSGSIKLLYSSPIRNRSIILGKFFSMMVYGAALLGILVVITLFCSLFVENFDYPILLTAMLGFYLLILAYSAIGIFMSSITRYQVVAAIGTLAVLAFLNYVG
jgi:ABC-2 type transport system permease protein